MGRFRWPPGGLGLGSPFNSILLTEKRRSDFSKFFWQSSGLGAATAILILVMDEFLFAGASLERVRILGREAVPVRVLIILYSSVTEELIYRAGVATFVGWIAAAALSRVGYGSESIAIWISILTAAILFGLAHVANLPNVPHPYLRAILLNGAAGTVFGWLYWRRGLEAAMAAHLSANAVLYLVVASVI